MTAVLPQGGERAQVQAQTQLRTHWFWLACLLLSALLLVPLWSHEYPGMTDYANHLARAQIIIDDQLHGTAHPYYMLRHVLVGNLGLDMLVPLLAHAGMGTNEALKLFAGVALLLPVVGVIALARVLQGGTPWLALLAFPLAHSRYYAWGFLNYFFSLGLALLVFALWLWLRERRPRLAALALVLLGVLVMCSHLMGFGVLALLVLSHEAWLLWRARLVPSKLRWGAALETLPALPALAALAACTLFYLLAFERGLGLEMRWYDTPAAKLRNLASPFIAYAILPGLAVMALVVGLVLWLWRTRRLRLQPGWWVPVGLFVLVFLVMPSVIMNSHYAGSRLLIVAALAFTAFATLRADVRGRVAVLLVALAATSIRVAEADAHWAETSARSVQLRQALQAVPQRARLATVLVAAPGSHAALHPLRHVASFALIDRQAFIPNFFGFPFNGESVAFRPEAAAITELVNKDHLIYRPDETIDWDLLCTHFDTVLTMGEGAEAPTPPCAMRVLSAGPGFGVYALRRLSAD
jgi:hypothetical protein